MFKGKPIYNVHIDLSLAITSFDNRLISAIDQIEMWGLAIHVAKDLIKGPHYVTKKGYLLPGHKKDIELRKAVLDLDENIPGLITLDKILKGEIKNGNGAVRPSIHLHYECGEIQHIKVDKSNLYIVEAREKLCY